MRAEDRSGLDRVDGLGLADPRDAAVGVADQEGAGPALVVAEHVLGLEQRGRQLAVHIGVDQRAVRPGLPVVDLGHVAGQQDGHGAQVVVAVLRLDDPLDRLLLPRLREAIQADADAAGAVLQQPADRVEHALSVGALSVDVGVDADHVALGDEGADRGRRAVAVEAALAARPDEQPQLGALTLTQGVGGDRR